LLWFGDGTPITATEERTDLFGLYDDLFISILPERLTSAPSEKKEAGGTISQSAA